MSHRFLVVSATLLLFLFSFSAQSQEPVTPAAGVDQSAAAATREKAIDLLSSIAGQVGTLRSAQNRARIGSTTAELLWDLDEKRSRRLFSAVAEDIQFGFNEAKVDLDADPYQNLQYQTLAVFGQLRSNTLERIARHDPQFALEFLRATRRPPGAESTYEASENESALELRLAGQIAAKSPELALELGREALAKGFSDELLNVLTQLKPGDKAAWQNFYKEIVDELKTANVAQDTAAEDLAVGLARQFPPPQADEQVYRDLIGLLVSSALAQGCAQPAEEDGEAEICGKIGSLFEKVEKYYPPRAPALKRWAEQAAQRELWNQVEEVVDKGTIDEGLAQAVKHPELADRVYWSVLMKASSAGDYARAREIALKTSDEEVRRTMLEQIKFAERMDAEILNRPATSADPVLPQSNEEQARALARKAMQLAKTDRKAALEYLDQARQMLESFKPTRSKLEGQIALAILFSSLQSDRGFTMVESLMPRFNELISAAAALDGIETNYLSEGEWNMTGQGAVGGLLTTLAQNAGYFSRLDFERSLTLVNQLERHEVRLMGQLMMVQGVLSDRSAGPMTLPRN